jgi:hypothetical protein
MLTKIIQAHFNKKPHEESKGMDIDSEEEGLTLD